MPLGYIKSMKERAFTRAEKANRNRAIVRWMQRHPTWTQEKTAEKFGISQPVLSRILKRMSRISTDES
jgi:DNA-binding transcriptional regulator LsrR (DeoR family)